MDPPFYLVTGSVFIKTKHVSPLSWLYSWEEGEFSPNVTADEGAEVPRNSRRTVASYCSTKRNGKINGVLGHVPVVAGKHTRNHKLS